MTLIKTIFLILHIAGGFTALLIGIIPMAVKKGSKAHRRAGWVYTVVMTDVFISSAVLSTILPIINGTKVNLFLLFIGVFSIYFVFSGLRGLQFQRARKEHGPNAFDYVVSAVLLLFSLGLLYFSFYDVQTLQYQFNVIYLVFAVFGINMARRDFMRYRVPYNKELHRHQYFFHHLTMMCASYISAVTAFLVVNVQFLPPALVWLGPGVVGGIGITYWTKFYKKKFASLPNAKAVKEPS